MRLLNIFAALSGVLALVMLVIASHALQDAHDIERIHIGGYLQLICAAATLAIANRSGRLNLIAGVMILGGAGIFAGTLYALALTHQESIVMAAPVGGITMILGWLLLAFTKPS
jgi:uncharacterized membrane protein YgdD (TMEM256/DUF423 family)